MSEPLNRAPHMEAFTFGDPEPVLDRRGIFDYLECVAFGGKWYEPPISWDDLAKTTTAAVHHASAMQVKRNILVSTYQPTRYLNRSDFGALVYDYLWSGNGYLELRNSRIGNLLTLKPALAKYVRRGVDLDQYWFVQGWKQEYEFPKGKVFHLRAPDINQEVYGMPEYLAALHSVLLNEAATLFRRKYYKNGSHAGFILYLTDPAQNQSDIDALREALKNAKGPGNFRNLFLYAPGGKKDGVQLIPVSEVAAKDEFLGIKNDSRDDMLAAHRVPPQLMGIIPNNTGGFGDAAKAAEVFYTNEIKPLQDRMLEINDWLGLEVVKFSEYALREGGA